MIRVVSILLLFWAGCHAPVSEVIPKQGDLFTQSTRIKPGDYFIPGPESPDSALIVIEGDDLVIDFQGAVLRGAEGEEIRRPDRYQGLAIWVRNSRNVTIRNAVIRGYKVALRADNCENLRITHCDLSYNYRQKLGSGRDREDIADWLSYHNNEEDEWLRYGAALYLKNCPGLQVDSCKVTGGQNALMMTRCDRGLIFNNDFSFNSGVGIGLYRSSHNRILHNKVDWCVRGYSHGIYQRGQDSAGILVYTESHENTIAFNSATHSGDGFFLWAGQPTMETGVGGCNDNLIYGNDFSHAPTNGVEVTFSRNTVVNNRIDECRYGIWGGYSYESQFVGNRIHNCRYGIAIEHGQQNLLAQNEIWSCEWGIQLWAREQDPNWGYVQHRDTRSKGYTLTGNLFWQVKIPFNIQRTSQVTFEQNRTEAFENLIESDSTYPIKADSTVFPLERSYIDSFSPPPFPEGQEAMLTESYPRGRDQIRITEWGPYDFRYPLAWLKVHDLEKGLLTFELLGPQGSWSLKESYGNFAILEEILSFRNALHVVYPKESDAMGGFILEFTGDTDFVSPFGAHIPAGEVYPVRFDLYDRKLPWELSWYAYEAKQDVAQDPNAFRLASSGKPLATDTPGRLAYNWWGAPAEGVPADSFLTLAEATADFGSGSVYELLLTSDDGVRLFVNDSLVIEHWGIHEPERNTATLLLSGNTRFRLEHFENTGFSCLDLRIKRRW